MHSITYKTIGIIVIGLLVAVGLVSCGKKKAATDETPIHIQAPNVKTINNETELYDAILKITDTDNIIWTQQLYSDLATRINVLESINKIQSADARLENLFVRSANCLLSRVDKEFRNPTYSNYSQLKADLNFLKKENEFLYKQNVVKQQSNSKLNEVQDIFSNYEQVLGLSRSQFWQSPGYMYAFSGSYQPTKSQIESNQYYSKYFSHNTDITEGVKEFPKRLESAKRKYYDDLEQLIERKIKNDNMTYEQCWDAMARFQQLTRSDNQTEAFNKLKHFVEEYERQLKSTQNANSSR